MQVSKKSCTFAPENEQASNPRQPMKKHLLIIALAIAGYAQAKTVSTLDSLLTVLEHEIENSPTYIAREENFIRSLCASKPMTPELQLRIAREYQHFQSDSSLVWYQKLKHTEGPIRTVAFIGLVQLLAYTGHYSDAIALMNDQNAPALEGADGYKMAWLLYDEVKSKAQTSLLYQEAQEKADHYYALMMEALVREAQESEESRLWLAQYRASEQGDWESALAYNEQLLNRYSPDDHMYAILAYGQAMLYEHAGDSLLRKEWLVRAAITDVRRGITDNGASWIVAQDCFDAGDLQHAYCINDYSLENATFFNAPARFIQNFSYGHLIASQHEYKLRSFFLITTIFSILLGIMLMVLAVAVIYSFRQNKRLHSLNDEMSSMNNELRTINHQLKEADKVKEQYICRYLEVYSDYIRRLTTMARKAGEKDPTAFMDREMENFYRSFDDTFLSLYGTFVQDFNALLKPEMRITPKPGERMSIEMRIFALILLGITSSAKIAELLCYSPNTISNYRVKMKNGALGDRDTFEQRVQMIGK